MELNNYRGVYSIDGPSAGTGPTSSSQQDTQDITCATSHLGAPRLGKQSDDSLELGDWLLEMMGKLP